MHLMLQNSRAFIVTESYLELRVGSGKYGINQWVRFCRDLMHRGYVLSMYQAQSTVSKYITVHGCNDDYYTVRFSNHKPNRTRELRGDCDFFCGKTHTGTRNTNDAIQAVLTHFQAT